MRTKVTKTKKLKDLRSPGTNSATMGNICSNLNNKAKKVINPKIVSE